MYAAFRQGGEFRVEFNAEPVATKSLRGGPSAASAEEGVEYQAALGWRATRTRWFQVAADHDVA
jgi:hypothetical protein